MDPVTPSKAWHHLLLGGSSPCPCKALWTRRFPGSIIGRATTQAEKERVQTALYATLRRREERKGGEGWDVTLLLCKRTLVQKLRIYPSFKTGYVVLLLLIMCLRPSSPSPFHSSRHLRTHELFDRALPTTQVPSALLSPRRRHTLDCNNSGLTTHQKNPPVVREK